MAYKRILIAIDISDEAEEVIAAARTLIQLQGECDVHLVTVISPISHAFGGLDAGGGYMVANLEQDIRKKTLVIMSDWAKELAIPQSSVHVKTGSAAAEIKATAENIEASLIVIGTHGRHGLGLILGSTANGVLHGVGCDVLAVRIQ